MYGVATFVRESLGPFTHAEPEWDREGRALFTTFPERKIALVNVYAVNGTDKPYFDHALGRVDGDRHAFKQRFQREIALYADTLPGELILAGDWNVTPTALTS